MSRYYSTLLIAIFLSFTFTTELIAQSLPNVAGEVMDGVNDFMRPDLHKRNDRQFRDMDRAEHQNGTHDLNINIQEANDTNKDEWAERYATPRPKKTSTPTVAPTPTANVAAKDKTLLEQEMLKVKEGKAAEEKPAQ